MFFSNDFEQFQLRKQELERQAEQERRLNDARWQNQRDARQQKRQQSKRTSLLTRISVLF